MERCKERERERKGRAGDRERKMMFCKQDRERELLEFFPRVVRAAPEKKICLRLDACTYKVKLSSTL